MRIASIGEVLFAAMLIALGIMGLAGADFAPIWQPSPKAPPAREVLVYGSACISLACGSGLLWQRTAAWAARVLLAYLLLWLILFRIPLIMAAPLSQDPWSGAGETAVVVAAAWAACGGRGMRIGRVFYGLALIPFGTGHFVFAKETASLVPAWLPLHMVWAYATGSAYIAAGLAILSGICARLAAVLSAWQIGSFTLLVWVPIVAKGHADAFVWSETVISFTLTACAWAVADSYRAT
jgi:uncharacterized membrane protein